MGCVVLCGAVWRCVVLCGAVWRCVVLCGAFCYFLLERCCLKVSRKPEGEASSVVVDAWVLGEHA